MAASIEIPTVWPAPADIGSKPVKCGIALLLVAIVGACSPQGPHTVALYRNSPLSSDIRVHWATFDASDGVEYNLGNCQMAVRILNANLEASAAAEAKRPPPNVGFWCEVGAYSDVG